MRKGFDYIGVGVCCWCHDGNGEVVLVKRSEKARDEHGNWDLIGGGIEFGDDIETTIRKEIREELDTDVVKFEFLGYFDAHREYKGEKTHWVQLAFKVLVDRSKVKNNEPHKFDDLQWYSLENLPNPLHSQFPKFLENYRDKLKTA